MPVLRLWDSLFTQEWLRNKEALRGGLVMCQEATLALAERGPTVKDSVDQEVQGKRQSSGASMTTTLSGQLMQSLCATKTGDFLGRLFSHLPGSSTTRQHLPNWPL